MLRLPASYLSIAAALYASLSGLILLRVPSDVPGPGVGAANRVTLVRATLAVPVGALALRAEVLDPGGYWWVIALATVVMILDGVDGLVARRTGTVSAFGARCDMELDAALIMALSVLVWTSGKVAVWVLLIGLMRYLFVFGAWVWPVLSGPLPESLRRRAVCVVQGVVLLVALGPIIPPSLATLVVGVGLAILTYSFSVDVHWLAGRGGRLPSRR